ncbi:hypothetical protein DFJ58DRAFT_783739 [Suillus subalutaceus]|uniref:uncharacterized protein n=1 Tax=Suillus subalutaceus TaxID=48586 RepID=UPI001B8683CA|nr:uncharacterized protein DFJ58DRAFT_783739 [Suillus subalutaceus]KAG1856962.1 hypothetical protein DFJ58DRAFT_783739 [Suillus subalutaceus]
MLKPQILTTSAVFLSTQPPMTSFLPYTLCVPYFFATLGCLMCGLAVVNIYDACDRTWVKDVLTASRFRLCCTLIFISWPSISLAVSIIFLILAMLNACYASGVLWFQCLTTVELLSWAWLPPLFDRLVRSHLKARDTVDCIYLVMFPGSSFLSRHRQ